jgi:hypothetical protein
MTHEAVTKEILAECEHLAKTMPAGLAHAFLTDLLASTVLDHLRSVEAKYELQPPATNTIQ